MLRLNSGRVAFGWVELAAAALIELVLTGRVSVQPARGFFRGVDDRNLVVVDPTPTGHSVLDGALAVLVGHAKPWRAMHSLTPVGRQVSPAVHAELQRRGFARVVGSFPDLGGYLQITNEEAQGEVKDRLDRARRVPLDVTDPRLGALVDVLRNSNDGFRGEQGVQPVIRWEWYPQDARDAVYAILWAERLRAGSQ